MLLEKQHTYLELSERAPRTLFFLHHWHYPPIQTIINQSTSFARAIMENIALGVESWTLIQHLGTPRAVCASQCHPSSCYISHIALTAVL